ncbi:hypothetical protein FUT69_02545 [Xylella taiwanensis]|uniref:Uncharacterized protein n=1 Tax=Xylella taiwanensis TaxID=1444770 RepID=Z9JI40_9GAMM|nr:hypothetical protein [Xylella taiwanensis]AXI83997.1 hypothetical protein AB672_08650 [Xylella taiwanensis]EWS77864.1 hypothetical protein AF72_08785 [Xylella taiwanensis]MCD8457109.1 hypothetical protein [Xylella taiwanensis]MCD8459517.1 hypothetical protein [Xylella taiwanensis]MCD8461615.1 hypothetical protein [Xylella taiwanensis]
MTKYYMRKNASWSLSNIFTGKVANAAINESIHSKLPGREDGPTDAYRHLLLSVQLTRIRGERYARAALNFHEWRGNKQGQSLASEQMNRTNNEFME